MTDEETTIIGIDPALRCTGYAAILLAGKQMEILDCGVIRNDAKERHSRCLYRIAGGIRELAERFQPQVGIIEGGFYGRNVKTAMVLGMVRGAILSVMAEYGMECYEYAPAKAKQMITGYGRASKEEIAQMMAGIFGIQVSHIPADATDALSLCVCHGLLLSTHNGVYLQDSV